MKVLLAGGGTGGHINPALAIASIIKQHDPSAEFLFVGTPNGMEARLVPAAGYALETMHVAGFQRKLNWKNIKRNCRAAYYLATSQHRAKQILKQFQPDIAIGTGGYVAGPILHAAAHMGIPCAIHEQNAFPGVTNKMLAKEVDHVMLTVEKALDYLHPDCAYTVTGLPVRGGIAGMDRAAARKKLGFDDGMCILSFGGSLGARRVNEVVADLCAWEQKNKKPVLHLHATGQYGVQLFQDLEKKKGFAPGESLVVKEYINNMPELLAAADLVISRAGALTLAELEAVGRAAVLIPSPNVAENHQYYNAMELQKAGAAVVIEEKDLTGEKLVQTVSGMLAQPGKLAEMGRNARSLSVDDSLDRIADALLKLVKTP